MDELLKLYIQSVNVLSEYQLKKLSWNYIVTYLKHRIRNVDLLNKPLQKYEIPYFQKGFQSKIFSEKELDAVKDVSSLYMVYNNFSTESMNYAISEHSRNISLIENPSEKLQLDVLDKWPQNFKYINNPTEYVKLLAVSRFGKNIEYIDNPSPKIMYHAVNNDIMAFYELLKKNIPIPKKIIYLAINKSAYNFIEIVNQFNFPLDKNMEKFLVKKDASTIRHIKNPSYELVKMAVTSSPGVIKFIKNPSEELQKMAVSIPGVRPGLATIFYLKQVMKRVTFFGAILLAILATLPNIIEGILNISSFNGLGTTSLLILVGVVLDTLQQIESHLLNRQYEGLMKSGRIKGRTSSMQLQS